MKETLKKIRELAEKHDISAYEIGKHTAVSQGTAHNILTDDKIIPRKKSLNYVIEYLLGFEDKNYEDQPWHTENMIKEGAKVGYNPNDGVPYFNMDATAHITSSFNDIKVAPEYYIDFKPFNDCDGWTNNYGNSMLPKYNNGDKIAVKQLFNFNVILWGEAHLIITNSNANDLRTNKLIFPHKEESKIILRSLNPDYAGDTVVNKEDILALFIIKGHVNQNF